MKKTLTIATLLSFMAVPSFAQSFDPDVGSGNIVPPVANQSGANAYAQAPDNYERGERGYVRAQTSRRIHHPAYRSERNPKRVYKDGAND
jgi:hypothetical protein